MGERFPRCTIRPCGKQYSGTPIQRTQGDYSNRPLDGGVLISEVYSKIISNIYNYTFIVRKRSFKCENRQSKLKLGTITSKINVNKRTHLKVAMYEVLHALSWLQVASNVTLFPRSISKSCTVNKGIHLGRLSGKTMKFHEILHIL